MDDEDSNELDELLEREGMEVDKEDIEDMKENIAHVENELENVSDLQWVYTKNLLKLSVLAWIFGFSVFLWELFLLEESWLGFLEPRVTIPLLIGTGVVPVIVTIFLVQRNRNRVDRLQRIRKSLLSKYHRTVLEKVERQVT